MGKRSRKKLNKGASGSGQSSPAVVVPLLTAGSFPLQRIDAFCDACAAGDTERYHELIQELDNEGADIREFINRVGRNGQTPLVAACLQQGRYDIVQHLLTGGADVNCYDLVRYDAEGKYSLTGQYDLEALKIFVEAGAVFSDAMIWTLIQIKGSPKDKKNIAELIKKSSLNSIEADSRQYLTNISVAPNGKEKSSAIVRGLLADGLSWTRIKTISLWFDFLLKHEFDFSTKDNKGQTFLDAILATTGNVQVLCKFLKNEKIKKTADNIKAVESWLEANKKQLNAEHENQVKNALGKAKGNDDGNNDTSSQKTAPPENQEPKIDALFLRQYYSPFLFLSKRYAPAKVMVRFIGATPYFVISIDHLKELYSEREKVLWVDAVASELSAVVTAGNSGDVEGFCYKIAASVLPNDLQSTLARPFSEALLTTEPDLRGGFAATQRECSKEEENQCDKKGKGKVVEEKEETPKQHSNYGAGSARFHKHSASGRDNRASHSKGQGESSKSMQSNQK